MDRTFTVTGMKSSACVGRVTKALLPFAEKVHVTLDPPRAVVRGVHSDASLEVMQIALAGAGKYTMAIAPPTFGAAVVGDIGAGQSESTFATYKPWLLIVGFVIGVTWLLHLQTPGRPWREWMSDFLAGYFLAFSFFKLLNLNGFVQAFRGYDLVAMRIDAYAWIYPFIELALGVAYLTRWQPSLTPVAALVVMLVSAAGIVNALRKRQLVECAALGTVFKLPLSKLTLAEHLTVAMMAVLMMSHV